MYQVRISKPYGHGTFKYYWLKGLDGAACQFDNETWAINAIDAAIEFYDIVGNDELQFQIINMEDGSEIGLPYE